MYSATERMQKMLAAGAPALARIDAILDGTDTAPNFIEQDTRLVTFTDAAKRLTVSRTTVYAMVANGLLEVRSTGNGRRIVLQSVFDYANGKRRECSRAHARAGA